MSELIDWPGEWPENELEYLGKCPICGHAERSLLFEKLTDLNQRCAPGYWTLWRCEACHAGYLDPRPTIQATGRAYAVYFTHTPPPWTLSKSAAASKRFARALANGYRARTFGSSLKPVTAVGFYLASLIPPIRRALDAETREPATLKQNARRRILDVGCGNGSYLQLVQHMGHEVYGVEPDAHARRIAQDAGIPLLGAVIEDVPDAYKASFDLVSLSHVIEHVHDPLKVLKHCHSLLKPGGTLWLETPNLSSYGAQHYGAGWRDLDPPRHLTLFNKNNMAGLLEDAGFADISFHRPKPVWREVYKASELNRRALFPALKTRAASECRLQGRLFAAVIRGRIATICRPDRGEFMTLTAKRC